MVAECSKIARHLKKGALAKGGRLGPRHFQGNCREEEGRIWVRVHALARHQIEGRFPPVCHSHSKTALVEPVISSAWEPRLPNSDLPARRLICCRSNSSASFREMVTRYLSQTAEGSEALCSSWIIWNPICCRFSSFSCLSLCSASARLHAKAVSRDCRLKDGSGASD